MSANGIRHFLDLSEIAKLELRGMINIPMEAFEEFCRAKTNFYIFEKVGEGPADAEGAQ